MQQWHTTTFITQKRELAQWASSSSSSSFASSPVQQSSVYRSTELNSSGGSVPSAHSACVKGMTFL